MNKTLTKQEVITGIKDEKYLGNLDECEESYNRGLSTALDYVKLLDEPMKPSLTKEEAEWLERLKAEKGNELDFCDKADLLYYITREGFMYNSFVFYPKDSRDLVSLEKKHKTTKMRLVWALLIGYTLEPDRYYTAKLKSTGEYLHYDADDNKFHHTFAFDSVAKRCESYHFTKDELVKYSAWENDYYDTCEVENEINRTKRCS